MAKKEKKFSVAELKKAMDDSYALGWKHAKDDKKVLGMLDPKIEAEMQLVSLNKSLDVNGKKINAEIIMRHREQVGKHMKAWANDADEALKNIIETDHKHGGA